MFPSLPPALLLCAPFGLSSLFPYRFLFVFSCQFLIKKINDAYLGLPQPHEWPTHPFVFSDNYYMFLYAPILFSCLTALQRLVVCHTVVKVCIFISFFFLLIILSAYIFHQVRFLFIIIKYLTGLLSISPDFHFVFSLKYFQACDTDLWLLFHD